LFVATHKVKKGRSKKGGTSTGSCSLKGAKQF